MQAGKQYPLTPKIIYVIILCFHNYLLFHIEQLFGSIVL